MGEIGRINPKCRRRVSGGLIGPRLGDRQGGARPRGLPTIGQAGELAGAGGVEGLGHVRPRRASLFRRGHCPSSTEAYDDRHDRCGPCFVPSTPSPMRGLSMGAAIRGN